MIEGSIHCHNLVISAFAFNQHFAILGNDVVQLVLGLYDLWPRQHVRGLRAGEGIDPIEGLVALHF